MNIPYHKSVTHNILVILFLLLFPVLKTAANPLIEITAPTNGTTLIEGDTIQINATASNTGGTAVYAVEFYINDVFIGIDTSVPYQFNWIGVEGTHLLTVREDHGACSKTSSVPVQVIVKKNVSPVIQLTSPSNGSTHFNPLPIDIEAMATDTDGVIERVDFFLNSVYIGSDQTAPFKIVWSGIPGIFTITAKAYDNKNVFTSSVPITVTVYTPPNVPPAVHITSPAEGASFILGNPVSISANAADTNDIITAVEFFANNVSIGTDATAPYEINWLGTPGIITLTAKATDGNCATTTSAPIHISITDPNAPPYTIQSISGQCSDPSFCLPIKAVLPVKDIIGYDLVLHYDKTKVQPTGTVTIAHDLINAGYASYVTNNIDSIGQIHISVFLNNSAPTTSSFQGIGELVCVEFTKTAGFAANDSAAFNITDLQESYANGVHTKQASPGKYINLKNTIYKGALQFWTDNSPIKYDALSPSQYLITNIYGTDSSCNNKSVTATQPDLAGKFLHNISNGISMRLERDILPGTDVQPVINGMDASLGYAVLLNDPSFIPSIYQLIALDVNMDGVISAGDLSQLNQRAIKTILEFKQKWNYTNSGNSNGKLSKDWIFLDSALLAAPAYKISSTYPMNDGVGYSKYKVPTVPFCLPVPSSVCNSCVVYKEGTFKGILLGDVNGNYDAIPADGQIKRMPDVNKGSIYLDLTKAKTGKDYIDVPVYFTSVEKIVALDFSLKLDESLQYGKITQASSYLNDALANLDDEHILRFTSNSRKNYETDKPLIVLRFETNNGKITSSDLDNLTGYLNGEPVPLEIKTSVSTRINNTIETKEVEIYPNPSSGILNVMVTENSILQVMDLQGKELMFKTQARANEKLELHLEDFKSGSYLLKVVNEKFVNTQVVVVESRN